MPAVSIHDEVSICSQALLKLGADPIQSFTDGSHEAAVCKYSFDVAYETLLASFPWNFARKKKLLVNPVSPAPINDFDYAFELPNDFVSLISVDSSMPWEIENSKRFLFSNSDGVYITYIAKLDVTNAPPQFVNALVWRIAADIAIAITDNTQRQLEMERMYASAVSVARASDLKTQGQAAIPTDIIIRERW